MTLALLVFVSTSNIYSFFEIINNKNYKELFELFTLQRC